MPLSYQDTISLNHFRFSLLKGGCKLVVSFLARVVTAVVFCLLLVSLEIRLKIIFQNKKPNFYVQRDIYCQEFQHNVHGFFSG